MFQLLTGSIDWPGMMTFTGFCVAIAIGFTAWINRPNHHIEQLKIELENSRRLRLDQMQHDLDLKKLQQNLITSHREAREEFEG